MEHIKKAYPLKVNSQGFIDIQDLKGLLNAREKYLVVIEYANSEIGTIQNVKRNYRFMSFLQCKSLRRLYRFN